MKHFAALLVLGFTVLFARADEPMIKVVVRQEAPTLAPGSYPTTPKTVYRLGPTKGRIEQAVDNDHHVQPLVIVDGKDAWFIDELSKTGKHMVDPSSDHTFYAPIVPNAEDQAVQGNDQLAVGGMQELRTFEIGHEMEFMRRHNVSPRAETEGDAKYSLYECTAQGYTLRLYLNQDSMVPAKSEVLQNGKLIVRLIYQQYQAVPADASLFRPPVGVKISEGQ